MTGPDLSELIVGGSGRGKGLEPGNPLSQPVELGLAQGADREMLAGGCLARLQPRLSQIQQLL
jgi:hypothetical protein